MANVRGCKLGVSEFKLQSLHYGHFQTNTFGKGMNLIIPPAMAQIVLLLFFCNDSFSKNYEDH